MVCFRTEFGSNRLKSQLIVTQRGVIYLEPQEVLGRPGRANTMDAKCPQRPSTFLFLLCHTLLVASRLQDGCSYSRHGVLVPGRKKQEGPGAKALLSSFDSIPRE